MKHQELSEILKHSFGLLAAYPKDPSVWKERRSLVCVASTNFEFEWNNELDLITQLIIAQYPNNNNCYRVWDYRRWIVENIIGSHKTAAIATKELEFSERVLLLSSGKNLQAWSHREWIIRKFDKALWLPEFQFCRGILVKYKNNLPAWDQICRAAREYKLDSSSRLNEAIFAKKAICARLGNEGPWTYLKVLYTRDKKSLYTNPDLECIYVDVLSDGAGRIMISKELDPNYDPECGLMYERDCVHALNLIADLIVLAGYDVNKNTRLVDAVNVVFACASDYVRGLPESMKEMGKGILGKVCAATFALGARRIRSCYRYKGRLFEDYSIKRGPAFEENNTTLCDNYDESSPQLVERLNSMFEAFNDVFTLYPELRKLLFKIYLKKGTRLEKEQTTLEEDLKWDVRRCVVKDIGTNVVGLDEIQFTTDIINEDPYNHRAWSYRQWVFQTFGRDWEDDDDELDFCVNIIERDTCNSFAWDQRFFLLRRWDLKLKAASTELLAHLIGEQSFKREMEEQEYAFKFIVSEPENELPWSQMLSSYLFCIKHLATDDVVLRVLEDATIDCSDVDEGIMGGDGQVVVVNARGVKNAVNMLLELVPRGLVFKEEQTEVFSQVMDQLCPDSYFHKEELCDDHFYRIRLKSPAILRRMEKALPGFGRSWENVTDRMLVDF